MLMLPEDLHPDRSLAGDDVGVIERMHEHQPLLAGQLDSVSVSVRITVAPKDDFPLQGADGIDLKAWSRDRHDNQRATAQPLGTQRNALGMVAGGRANHAPLELFGGESG